MALFLLIIVCRNQLAISISFINMKQFLTGTVINLKHNNHVFSIDFQQHKPSPTLGRARPISTQANNNKNNAILMRSSSLDKLASLSVTSARLVSVDALQT